MEVSVVVELVVIVEVVEVCVDVFIKKPCESNVRSNSPLTLVNGGMAVLSLLSEIGCSVDMVGSGMV